MYSRGLKYVSKQIFDDSHFTSMSVSSDWVVPRLLVASHTNRPALFLEMAGSSRMWVRLTTWPEFRCRHVTEAGGLAVT